MKFLPREEYEYRDCKVRMSQRAMADLLYAAISTKSGLPHFHGVVIHQYTRKQNAFNRVDVKVHIHPSQIAEFEGIAGVKLTMPITVHLNMDDTIPNKS